MDILSPLFLLLFRSFVILLPLTIGWLAFRRLAMSKSGNAWMYAITCLFAVVTSAGLLPWAVGIKQASWVFFVLGAFCPAIWIGVITICDMSRRTVYGHDPVKDAVITFTSRQKSTPLVLENPTLPGAPIPVFRHRKRESGEVAFVRGQLPVATQQEQKPRSLLAVAREMRGKDNSDDRRPKLLPAPEIQSLPFLKS